MGIEREIQRNVYRLRGQLGCKRHFARLRLIAPCLIAAATVVLLLAVAPAAMAAPASAAWALESSNSPTNLPANTEAEVEQGPEVDVTATNIGGARTDAVFTIIDELPPGLSPSPIEEPTIRYGRPGFLRNVPCSVEGRLITCEGGEPLGGEPEVTRNYVPTTGVVSMRIYVRVEASPGTVLTNTVTIEGGGGVRLTRTSTTTVSEEVPTFGFAEGSSAPLSTATADTGASETQAGATPGDYEVMSSSFNKYSRFFTEGLSGSFAAGGGLKDVRVRLPHGLVVNPQAAPKCTEAELETEYREISEGKGCPTDSVIGAIILQTDLTGFEAGPIPLYNMVPPAGTPAEFGFTFIAGLYSHVEGFVRTGEGYGLGAVATDIPAKVAIGGIKVNLWGDPSSETHNESRGLCLYEFQIIPACPAEGAGTAPFVSMPSSCGGALTTEMGIDSWAEPADEIWRSFPSADPNGKPVGVDGCGRLGFAPSIQVQPSNANGESPSGLNFALHVPQAEGVDSTRTANVKDVSVALPEGLVVNPAAGNGLGSCTEAEIDLDGPGAAECPDQSKLGSAEILTPLLEKPLEGSVYLAKPFANPFHSLLALYIAFHQPKTGVVIKLPGEVQTNPVTGQLTAVFKENPELPFSDLKLSLFEGSRASLTTPIGCGGHVSTSTITPWSTPEGDDVHPTGSFETTASCYSSESQAPKAVSFVAGTVSPLSGAYSPFSLWVSRPDGSQHITGIETTLPQGLLGKLAGISYCPESGIAQARSREAPEQGKLEQQSPSCPGSSEVGTVNVTAGSGVTPIPVSGHAYLAGPYKGAALSLVVIVPAVAGPFDLGTVVDRVALNVGEYDARIHAVADPLPTIRDGIPLDVRSIELKLDRPGFTLNPTSCEAMQIEGSVSTQAGQAAPLENSFQVGECRRLAFKPKIAISLKGPTKRTGHPALKAIVTYPRGGEYANIAKVQVSLPHSEFLDQGNLNNVCTKPVLAAGACPANSIYGKVKAWTPLLGKPLEGLVYLVGGYGYKLPALVAELNGQIRVLLVGKVDTDKQKGVRNTFEAVPDAPVERFVLEMKGGKKYGLFENSENVCKETQRASAQFRAHNGKLEHLYPRIANSCKAGSRRGKEKRGRRGA